MARTFDGVDDLITVSLGAMGFVMGPGTVAAIIKRGTDGVAHFIFIAGVGNGARWGLRIPATNILSLDLNATAKAAPAGIDTCLVADGWLLVAASKATGTVVPRFHRYEYATGVWQHADGASTNANSGTPATSCTIGANYVPALWFSGDVSVVGGWGVVLTDAQVEAMAYSLPAWFAVQPKGLWLLDQDATTQKVIDITGGGANESALVGTTVGTSSVPVFSYGHEIQMVTANSVAVILAALPQIRVVRQAVTRGAYY